jgi:hypothetical protein
VLKKTGVRPSKIACAKCGKFDGEQSESPNEQRGPTGTLQKFGPKLAKVPKLHGAFHRKRRNTTGEMEQVNDETPSHAYTLGDSPIIGFGWIQSHSLPPCGILPISDYHTEEIIRAIANTVCLGMKISKKTRPQST